MLLPNLVVGLLLLATPQAEKKKATQTEAEEPIPTAPRSPVPLLKDGDRVVFLGDSITVAHTSMRDVELYLKLRHPEISVSFINAGIGGHTVYDALYRFDTDVAAYQPTVVVVNFGMNDAGYPPEAEGAAFEKNMGALLDRLQKLPGLRLIVWADTTPFDTWGLGKSHKNTLREHRIVELCKFAHEEGRKRNAVVVDWHDPLKRAVATWRTARPYEEKQLIPDRVHPSAPAHALMASQLLGALGYDLTPSVIGGSFDGKALTLSPRAGVTTAANWDGKGAVAIDIKEARAPLPFVGDPRDALDLSSTELGDLRKLVLKVAGVPKGRWRISLGDTAVGVFSDVEIAKGVDLMATTLKKPPVPPTNPAPPEQRPTLQACSASSGNPYQNDFDCFSDLLLEKDALRVTMRHEKTRTLPDFVPGHLEKFWSITRDWIAAVEADVNARAKATRQKPKTLTIERE